MVEDQWQPQHSIERDRIRFGDVSSILCAL